MPKSHGVKGAFFMSSSFQRFPRFLTFQPGEREALLEERLGLSVTESTPYETTKRSGLVKAHTFAVCFPDRTEGTCRYERRGPSLHLFHYTYQDGAILPMQWWSERLASYVPTIEAKGKELAEPGFYRACNEEREKYFQRASLPTDGSRIRRPVRSQMTAARAKELSGRYALCLPLNRSLVAINATLFTLAEANVAWTQQQDKRLVVACFNRLDRCWEIPKYNPLYAAFEPHIEGIQKGEFPWSSWK
jgi:hypothetical protein